MRHFAVQLISGRAIYDLDSGRNDQKGYVSLLHGAVPRLHHFSSFAKESEFLVASIARLQTEGILLETVYLVARTKRLVQAYAEAFRAAGLVVYEIKRNTADQREKPGVRVATVHRVKGLEFEHLFIVAANDGVLPLTAAIEDVEDEVGRRNSETAERLLLYVALTRARRSATITGYGTASSLLPLEEPAGVPARQRVEL